MSVLADLLPDLARYRVSVDVLLEAAPQDPQTCPKHFLEVLIASSKLYLGFLLVWRELPNLYAICVPNSTRVTDNEPASNFRNIARRAAPLDTEAVFTQAGYRKQVRRILSPSLLAAFTPEDAFSDNTGLHSLEDYTNNLSLHLSEIYAETFRVERHVRAFLHSERDDDLSILFIGMQHMCPNHISWLQPALERLANEDRWYF